MIARSTHIAAVTSALAAAVAALASCSAPAPEGPTYWRDVQPILEARCEGCHRADGMGPFDLTGYQRAQANAPGIAGAAASRTMPPWLPAAEPKLRHERRLTDAEIETLKAWARAGAPEGDPKDKPARPATGDIPTIEVDAEVAMASSYRPKTAESDDYHCFVLDPQLTKDTAVVGFDIRPGNRRIVHHVILYAVTPENQAELARVDAREPEEGFTCFGDAGVEALMVGAWVPGTTATVFPLGTGVLLERGTKLVMQVHYNTLEVKDGEDRTTALLDYRPAAEVSEALILPVLQSHFEVLPGEVKTVTTTIDTSRDLPAGLSVKVHGAAPHMHLHGTRIRALLQKKGEAAQQTLIDIPRWNFHWQQLYFYDEPFTITSGDRITLECTFDNRPEAQPIVNGQRTPAKTLRWGEGTLEEMCLSFFYLTL